MREEVVWAEGDTGLPRPAERGRQEADLADVAEEWKADLAAMLPFKVEDAANGQAIHVGPLLEACPLLRYSAQSAGIRCGAVAEPKVFLSLPLEIGKQSELGVKFR